MTLINDVTDTWKAYLAAVKSGDQAAQDEERNELIYDIRNFLFSGKNLDERAFSMLGDTDMDIVRLSAAVVSLTLPDGEVVEIQSKR